MTQIAAIAIALLKGEVISIRTAFDMFGCTNAPREIGRSIERKFGVQVSRTPTKFKPRYGKAGMYYRYRLNRTDYNAEGIQKMTAYVQKEMSPSNPKTMKEKKNLNTIKQLSFYE